MVSFEDHLDQEYGDKDYIRRFGSSFATDSRRIIKKHWAQQLRLSIWIFGITLPPYMTNIAMYTSLVLSTKNPYSGDMALLLALSDMLSERK